MLSFAVYSNGKACTDANLAGAYLVGSDDVPVRAELSFAKGVIRCKKRAGGPAGLALSWAVDGVGTILLETVRVPPREKPYILQIELARARLMRVNQKLEDWGLLDFEDVEDLTARISQSRDTLIRALQADTPEEAAALGQAALTEAVVVSEELCAWHANALLSRRQQIGGFGRAVLGCAASLETPTDVVRERIAPAFDFVTVPFVWRDIEPSEQTFNWTPLDTWVETLTKHHIPMRGASLLSFRETHVPDWLYIWEHDFDTIRDLAFEHVRRVINRYGQHIHAWEVISGIHANNCFTFSFEQLMELTRMAASLVKQTSPLSAAIIEIVAPWGEYYARNQRTIPPVLYADMVVQSGVAFDAFGLQFHFGANVDGMFVRDMFQITCILDAFAKLGKPLHITAVQVPSQPVDKDKNVASGGMWHEPWSESVQAEWLARFFDVALGKPFVESVCWQKLSDDSGQATAPGGLLTVDRAPKPAYDALVNVRSRIRGTR